MLPLSTPLLNKLFPYSILQTITSPKPSPPPTLKSWWLYRWNRFKQRTDKWELLQWYLVILAIITCIFFSSLYQGWVMDLDRTNRKFRIWKLPNPICWYSSDSRSETTRAEIFDNENSRCSRVSFTERMVPP